MRIQYLGHSCFRLTSTSGVTVVTDPYSGVGYEMPAGVTVDVVTVSHGHFDHNCTQAIESPFVVADQAQDYEFKDLRIHGVKTFHDPVGGALRGENVMFTIEIDGIRVCHFGDLGEACSAELLRKIGKPDVLLLPIGGTYTITAEQAKVYVDELSPKAVIPMHYRPQDGQLDIQSADAFLKLFDTNSVEYVKNGEYVFSIAEWETGKKKILYLDRVEGI